MGRTVFISRHQEPDSPFSQRLREAGWAVEGRSLLCFSPVSFSEVPEADWVFFYSKRAVTFFYEQLEKAPNVRWAAIGPGTARAMRECGLPVDFQGEGDPPLVAQAFLHVAAGRRVLFPRARRSRRSVQQLLEGGIQVLDLVVYDNQACADLVLPPAEVLVFTSPMNARAYFAERTLTPGQKVVAIGQTTAVTLTEIGVMPDAVAAEPTEEALAAAVLARTSR